MRAGRRTPAARAGVQAAPWVGTGRKDQKQSLRQRRHRSRAVLPARGRGKARMWAGGRRLLEPPEEGAGGLGSGCRGAAWRREPRAGFWLRQLAKLV